MKQILFRYVCISKDNNDLNDNDAISDMHATQQQEGK